MFSYEFLWALTNELTLSYKYFLGVFLFYTFFLWCKILYFLQLNLLILFFVTFPTPLEFKALPCFHITIKYASYIDQWKYRYGMVLFKYILKLYSWFHFIPQKTDPSPQYAHGEKKKRYYNNITYYMVKLEYYSRYSCSYPQIPFVYVKNPSFLLLSCFSFLFHGLWNTFYFLKQFSPCPSFACLVWVKTTKALHLN